MSNHVSREVRDLVAERAGEICEYCLIAQEDAYFRHQIEHVISIKHGGSSDPNNLAFACIFCNRNKGSDIATMSVTGELVRFFNPRTDIWSEHFVLKGANFVPLSDVGEATIRILRMNDDERISERLVMIKTGRYPNENAMTLIRIQ